MSVRRLDASCIALEGPCPVDDAEPLLQFLQATPAARCDWAKCGHLHSAVIQVILAARPVLVGPCGDPWVEAWIAKAVAG